MSDSELNGNITQAVDIKRTTSSSVEDLSEYTDADESISAPTEILAEFLSAIMIKDYDKALRYCKLILHYEPNNTTAQDFYPLIVEKLEMRRQEDSLSESSSDSSSSMSSSSSDCGKDPNHDPTHSDGTSGSYSSLEDDEDHFEKNETDITNGNVNNIQTNISPTLPIENRPKKEDDSSLPPKLLIHPTPTTTLKRDSFLGRTKTYTKILSTENENATNVNNLRSPVKNLNRLNNSPKRMGKKITPNIDLSKYVKKKKPN